jgi:hypothetical protein
MGEKKNAFMDLVGTPEGHRPLKSSRLGLGDNINMDLKLLNGIAWTG